MKFEVYARHCEVDPEVRMHCEEKLSVLEKLWPKVEDANLRATFERGRYNAELTLVSGGMITRGEDRADNLRQAVDKALAKLEKQVRRYKKRLQSQQRRYDHRDDVSGTVVNPADVPAEVAAEIALQLEPAAAATDGSAAHDAVRIKRFALKPMAPGEAALQMDLLGHAFFVFRDAESNQTSVVYRRRDGSYGLIEPVAA